jgi:hypothetical protein
MFSNSDGSDLAHTYEFQALLFEVLPDWRERGCKFSPSPCHKPSPQYSPQKVLAREPRISFYFIIHGSHYFACAFS